MSLEIYQQIYRQIHHPLDEQLDEQLQIDFWLVLRYQLAHPPIILQDSQILGVLHRHLKSISYVPENSSRNLVSRLPVL
jgi:hypothetical protein